MNRTPGSRLAWLAVLLLASVLASACATPGQRAEQQRRARKAVSHLDIGADHLHNGRSALALREFVVAERLDPDNPRIQYALGEAYWARDRIEDAEAHLRRALETHPDYHDARLHLSALLVRTERFEEAIVECDRLLDDPTFSTPWRALANRGWAEIQLGRHSEARRSLELAREYSPEFWPATLSLAILEVAEGHRLEAVGLFQEILSIGPGPLVESETNYRLAEVYISLGKRRRALGHLTASVARQPEGPWARKSEEYLKLLR